MPARKRNFVEMEESSSDSIPEVSAELTTLKRVRGMWEFAAFMQYLFFFGKAVKVDIDVEDFEDECLKPGPSERLSQIALALLKNVSSHKGLTLDLVDEYTRRQYVAKAPKRNPFGDEDEPRKFADLDVFTKIRVLNQLAVWTLHNPVPIREKLDERESAQLEWRIEPFGWDKEDRVYYILDDNRLYRQTNASPPPDVVPSTPKKSKAKGRKSNGRNTRSAKRQRIGRRVIETSPEETEAEEPEEVAGVAEDEAAMDDFYMQRWELIAVSKDEYDEFLDTIKKSKNADEKTLFKQIQEHVMPILLEAEEERQRKEARRMKELEIMEKMASSKRSSRLQGKQDKAREEREAAEAEAARKAELVMAHKEQRRVEQMEHDRESRRETREQRLKEREVKRILEQERLEKEQEMLAKMEKEGVLVDTERGRISERQLKSDMEKRKRDLESLQPDDSWYFDCVCGTHGPNLDDGSHSIACEKCSTWQHSKCNGISEQQAERDDFQFVCRDCKRKEENPLPKIKLKMGSSPQTSAAKPASKPRVASGVVINRSPKPNGTTASGIVYPGPPPPAPPMLNGRPSSNGGNAPVAYQWQAYQPPQSVRPAGYPQYQTHYGQQAPPANRGPTSPVTDNFNHHTPYSYAQSQSPPRHGNAYAPPRPQNTQLPSLLSQTGQPQYQGSHHQPPHQPNAHYQQASHPPPAPPQMNRYPLPDALPPLQQITGQQGPGSPSKRPGSSDFGPRIPPPIMNPSYTNGSHAHQALPPPPQFPPTQNRPTSSHAPLHPPPQQQIVTPAPAPRAPIFTPNSSFSASASGQPNHTPFNAAPGYSPVKQASPKTGAPQSSPHAQTYSSAAPSPAASFGPPKQDGGAGVSPVKHDSLPTSEQSKGGPQVAVMDQRSEGSTAPAGQLVNPALHAPELVASPQVLPLAPAPAPVAVQHANGGDTNGA